MTDTIAKGFMLHTEQHLQQKLCARLQNLSGEIDQAIRLANEGKTPRIRTIVHLRDEKLDPLCGQGTYHGDSTVGLIELVTCVDCRRRWKGMQ